jgi:hypothetical protein
LRCGLGLYCYIFTSHIAGCDGCIAADKNRARRVERPAEDFSRSTDHSGEARHSHALHPKWIPGEQRPAAVIDLAGVKFTANREPLKWRRALDDNFTFQIEVPDGVQEVHAELDFL